MTEYSKDFEWNFGSSSGGGGGGVDNLDGKLEEELQGWCEQLGGLVDVQFRHLVESTCADIGRRAPSARDGTEVNRLFQFLLQHPCAHPIKELWPEHLGFRGVGFKIGPAGKKTLRAPDDRLYMDHPVLQKYLPRGLVFAVPLAKSGAEVSLAVFANRKFFGRRRGDDDDSDLVSPALATGEDEPFDSFVETEKANGEACQVGLLQLADDGDRLVWTVGSKNRKIAVSRPADVAEYDGQTAYQYAVEMARCFFATLPDAQTQRLPLARFLHATGLTLNFEYESPAHQHLVPLTEERLVLIGGSGVHVGAAAAHPVFGYAIAKRFGFPSVLDRAAHAGRLAVRPVSELADACAAIGQEWESEGAVLVLLETESRRVHDLVKVKTFWYVCLRAIREKLARLQGPAGVRRCCALIRARLQTLRHSLAIPPAVAGRFADLGCWFAGWLALAPDTRLVNFRDRYPSLWTEFLRAHGLPVDASLVDVDGAWPDRRLREAVPSAVRVASTAAAPLLVLTQGLPGLGKSLLAGRLAAALSAQGLPAVQVAQDDFVHLGPKKASSACLQHVRELLESGAHRVVIVARNNANMFQTNKYVNLDRRDGLARVVFLCPEELSTVAGTDDAARLRRVLLAYLCCASVVHRRLSGEPHDGTRDLALPALAALPVKFLTDFRPEPAAITMRVLCPDAWTDQPNRLLEQWIADGTARQQFVEFVENAKLADIEPLMTAKESSNDSKTTTTTNASNGSSLPPFSELFTWAGLDHAEHCQRVCKEGHVPVDQLVDSVIGGVKRAHQADLPPFGSFLGVRLDDQTRHQMLSLAAAPRAEWASHGDHITLVHSHSCLRDEGGADAWARAARHTGQDVVFRYRTKPLTTSSLHVVPIESLRAADNPNEDLRALVFSGAPHVTLRTAPGTKASESILIVRGGEKADGSLMEGHGTIELIEK